MKKLILIFLVVLSTNLYSRAPESANNPRENLIISAEKNEIIVPEKKSDKGISDLIREWLLTISGIGTLITLSIGIWKSLAEYRLKIRAENRVTESTRTEADIKLVKHFTEIMDVAHGRSGYQVSETIIEKLFEKDFVTSGDLQNLKALNQKIEDAAILTFPVGSAAQDAAMASIAELAIRHEVLRIPAMQALESMMYFKKELCEKYLTKIKENSKITAKK